MYEYNAIIQRVIDGDTVVVGIDLGFNTWINTEHVRLARINTPELRTLDLEEKEKGIAARDYVLDCIDKYGPRIKLRTLKSKGKYGRYLGEIVFTVESEDGGPLCLNDLLVEAGHAEYVDYL